MAKKMDLEQLRASRAKLIDDFMENVLLDMPSTYKGFHYEIILDDIVITDIEDASVVKRGTLAIPEEFTQVSDNPVLHEKLMQLAPKKIEAGTLFKLHGVFNIPSVETIAGEYVTGIGDYAFMSCSSLKNIELPELMAVGNRGFANCRNLRTVNLPRLQAVGAEAFAGCTSLEKFSAENLSLIDYDNPVGVFSGCEHLSDVNIKRAAVLPARTFEGCTSLMSLNLPNVRLIATLALSGCQNLTKLRLDSIVGFKKNSLLNCGLQVLNYGGSPQDFINVKIEDMNELNVFKGVKINYNYKEK